MMPSIDMRWSAIASLRTLADKVGLKMISRDDGSVSFNPSGTLHVIFHSVPVALMWFAGYAAALGLVDEHNEAFKIGAIMSGEPPETFSDEATK